MLFLLRLIIGLVIEGMVLWLTVGLDSVIDSMSASFGVMAAVYGIVAYFLGWIFVRLMEKFTASAWGVSVYDRLVNFCIFLAVGLWLLSWWNLRTLPGPEMIVPELYHEPAQTPVHEETLNFDYRGTSYGVKPQAEYELWGLVVTHNDIGAWYNYYHNEDSVNLKDLCVIWGDNVKGDFYQRMKYDSGEWTCYFQADKRADWLKFKPEELSNNHLIAADERVQDIIRRVRVGDQVHFQGYLASYGTADTPESQWRGTSLTRTDTGNGACETVFVKNIEILAPGNSGWYALAKNALIALFILLWFKVILFFFHHRKIIFNTEEN